MQENGAGFNENKIDVNYFVIGFMHNRLQPR